MLNTKFFDEKNSTKQDPQDEKQDASLTENKQRCIELGCQQGSVYIGSKNSDKYYECTCHYAERIHPENIICFKTKTEAEAEDRIFLEC